MQSARASCFAQNKRYADIQDNLLRFLISVGDYSAVTLQFAVPMKKGMVMTARIKILIAPVDTKIKFHEIYTLSVN